MRNEWWRAIKNIQKMQDKTIILKTNYIEEASDADNILIINRGKIIAKGNPNSLRDRFINDYIMIFPKNQEIVKEILKRNSIEFSVINGVIKVILQNTVDALPILELCKEKCDSFEVIKGSLESAYLSIIERSNSYV